MMKHGLISFWQVARWYADALFHKGKGIYCYRHLLTSTGIYRCRHVQTSTVTGLMLKYAAECQSLSVSEKSVPMEFACQAGCLYSTHLLLPCGFQVAETASGRKTPPAEGSSSEQKQPAAISEQEAAEQDQQEVRTRRGFWPGRQRQSDLCSLQEITAIWCPYINEAPGGRWQPVLDH